MITQLKFVGVPTSDQQRALRFYTEKLGFAVSTDQPFNDKLRWIELRIGSAQTRIVLFTPPGHEDRIGSFFFLMRPVSALRSAAWTSRGISAGSAGGG